MHRLVKTLAETNRQWKIFNSKNGDVSYFSDPESSNADTYKVSLCNIDEAFQRLETVERSLKALAKSCKYSSEAVSKKELPFLTCRSQFTLTNNVSYTFAWRSNQQKPYIPAELQQTFRYL